eukprot:scaffold11292_cov30-Prasinocladus_malaysianus.AAC.1
MEDLDHDIMQLQQEQEAFASRWAEGGSGWDDDGDGMVSHGEALTMVKDMGALSTTASCVFDGFNARSVSSQPVACSALSSAVSALFLKNRVGSSFKCSSFDLDSDGQVSLGELASAVSSGNMITTVDGKDAWQEAIETAGTVVNKVKSWVNTFKSVGSKISKALKTTSKFSPSKTAKTCWSGFKGVYDYAKLGSKAGGVYGAVTGGIVGAVVNGKKIIGCAKGVIKYAKPVYELGKKVINTAVDVVKKTGSVIKSAVSGIWNAVTGIFTGRRRGLLALPGTAEPTRHLLQLDEEDPEFDAELVQLDVEAKLTEMGSGFLDGLLLVDEIMEAGNVPFTELACQALRNITLFTSSVFGAGDLQAVAEVLPENATSILPMVETQDNLLTAWSSKAQERLSLAMQVNLMNAEQNTFNCFANGECANPTLAQLDQLKHLLLHKLEDQTFVLLDVLSTEVRQYEYWSLSTSPYSTGFPLSRYNLDLATQNFCNDLKGIQSSILQDATDRAEALGNQQRMSAWVYHELSPSNIAHQAVFQQLLFQAINRNLTSEYEWQPKFYQPMATISLKPPEKSHLWQTTVSEVRAYVTPVPSSQSQIRVTLQKDRSSVFFLPDGQSKASCLCSGFFSMSFANRYCQHVCIVNG